MTKVTERIGILLDDKALPETEKIQFLRQLEADAQSKERSATEGFMPVDGDDGEDLNAIEKALISLGAGPSVRTAPTL